MTRFITTLVVISEADVISEVDDDLMGDVLMGLTGVVEVHGLGVKDDDRCEGCGKEWKPGAEDSGQWGVYHGRKHEPWLCPRCIDDNSTCERLGG